MEVKDTKELKEVKTATTRKNKKTVTYQNEVIYRLDEDGHYQPLEANIINEEWEETADINFDKIWLLNVLDALGEVGNKKIKVASYILNNRDKNNNILIKTQREIAEECGLSVQTVSLTIKALEGANLITSKTGVYQVNPDFLARGSHNKRMAILRIYQKNKASKNK